MTRPSKASLDEIPELDAKRARVVGRGLAKHRHLSLRALREAVGKTQAEVARAAEMDQGDVSRLEVREDIRMSTLRRYAAALGGGLEIYIVIRGRSYRIEL
jgi:hypothetical protein